MKQEEHTPSQSIFLGGYAVFAISVGALLVIANRILPYSFFDELLVVIVPPLFYAVLHYPPRVHRFCIVIMVVIAVVVVYFTTKGSSFLDESLYTVAAVVALFTVTAEFVHWSVSSRQRAEAERKRVEEELAGQIRYREILLDSLPHPAMLIDKYRMILASNYVARETGAEPGERCWEGFGKCKYIPERDRRFVEEHKCTPPEGTHCSFCKAEQCLALEEPQNDPEVEAFGSIWDTYWIPLYDGIYLHYAIDVTEQKEREAERKRAEESLRESEERFRTIYENAPALINAFDENGRCVLWNRRCCEVFGWTIDEINAHDDALSLFYPDPTVRDEVMRSIIAGPDRRFREWYPLAKDGKMLTTLWANFQLTDGMVISLGYDITEEERAKQEKGVLEAQLRQAQKMEAVGQLAGGIAHDFNNILQGIMGYTEMAKSGLSPEDPAYRDMQQVKVGADRAATLTRQLLAFSRRQMIQPVDLGLNEVITDISRMLRRVIGEHIELDLKLHANAGTVHADAGAMEQVLMNLCVNARDAIPSGGQLVIETEQVSFSDGFCETHPWASPGDYALLSVTDTGVGMPPDVVEHIFEPFFTTKETGKGTGLGLSMVYGIVKQHDGLIHCYSELGKGSCFKIYLPSVERDVDTAVKPAATVVPAGGTETVLLAEDDEMVRDLAVLTLERSGYRVLVAKDGGEALRLFEEHQKEIELALLDVVMPKVGGREVYDTIRASSSNLPVLFSSGYSTNAIHTGFVVEEGLETIQKPYSPNALLRKIREVLDGG